jgi:3-hydroxyisobutyrate dehydrogenase
MTRIGFIGLGNMGLPMAGNLAKSGNAVQGFDLVAANVAKAESAGVAKARDAKEAAASKEIVITMVPAGAHVLSLYDEILDVVAKGTLIIDCSTIDVASARKAHEMAKSHGLASLDAPVSGGTAGAAAATLTFMAGGSAEAFARAEPVLAQMGKRIIHCGDEGAGQAAKICNNMILGISMIGVCEAFTLAEKLSLSAKALYDVASVSSGQCWSLTTYCPVPGVGPKTPADNDYRPGFATALMLKDLTLAQESATATGAATPLGAHAQALYTAFAEAGGAEKDFSAIIRYLAEKCR